MAHVGVHDVEAVLRDHAAKFRRALLVGGYLGPQVGEVGLRVARRVLGGFQEVDGFRLPQPAVIDQEPVVDEDASSSIRLLLAGMEPGEMPPISAWWPREAT